MNTLILGLILGCTTVQNADQQGGSAGAANSSTLRALPKTGKVIAIVNNVELHEGAAEAMFSAMAGDAPPEKIESFKNSGGIKQVIDNLVLGELLYQKALKAQLDQVPEVQSTIVLAERSIMAQKLVDVKVTARVTDAVLKRWYDDHSVQYSDTMFDLSSQ